MSHKGRYELRRVAKAVIEASGGEISMDKLVAHLIGLGYHGPSVRRVLPILDPGIIFKDGRLSLKS